MRCAWLVALILAPGIAFADPPARTFKSAGQIVVPVARQAVRDAKDLATAPLRWRRHEWTRFGEGVAVVLAAYAFDNQIVNFVSHQNNRLLDHYLTFMTHFGGGYGTDVALIMAGGGFFLRDDRMMSAGIDAFESTTVASEVVAPVIKTVVGRARPIYGLGKHSFHPFDSHDQSFPSNHATSAFALATAIATRYDDSRWVPAVAYGVATSVAIARVHDRVHFASDVLAGGMIGHAIARSIVANHRHARVAFIPTLDGFRVDIRF